MEEHDALNIALKLLIKRGIANSSHIEVVLHKKFPSMSKDAVGQIVSQADEIVESAIELANRVCREDISREDAISAIHQKWPMLTDDSLEELYTHAWFIAVR